MAKVRLPPIGFWSYVRRDDERLGHKISELRELVLAELETQIGGDVPVFKDTISIPNGERWEELTVRALDDATFFIPILTPAFLKSEWCCREVRLFLDREQALFAAHPDLPRRSQIFPIHYVEVDEDADTADEAIRDTLMQLQHFSFHGRRNLRYDEPEVRDFISGFVADIRKLLKAWVEERELPPPPPPPTAPRPQKPRPQAKSSPRGPVASPPPPPPPPPPPRSSVAREDGPADAAADAASAETLIKRILLGLALFVLVLIVIAVIAGRASQGGNANSMSNEANGIYDPCAYDSYSGDCLNSMPTTANVLNETSENVADNMADAYPSNAAGPLNDSLGNASNGL